MTATRSRRGRGQERAASDLFRGVRLAEEPRRFVDHFAWAYRRWHAHPDAWLGVAGPVLDDAGWLTFDEHSGVCPLHFLHLLARFDRARGIARTDIGLEDAIRRHWPRCIDSDGTEAA